MAASSGNRSHVSASGPPDAASSGNRSHVSFDLRQPAMEDLVDVVSLSSELDVQSSTPADAGAITRVLHRHTGEFALVKGDGWVFLMFFSGFLQNVCFS